MNDNQITEIMGWPTEPEMKKYRKLVLATIAESEAQYATSIKETRVKFSNNKTVLEALDYLESVFVILLERGKS